jgi:hypothetical protein
MSTIPNMTKMAIGTNTLMRLTMNITIMKKMPTMWPDYMPCLRPSRIYAASTAIRAVASTRIAPRITR